jgi:cobalamin biosynthesis protein CobW
VPPLDDPEAFVARVRAMLGQHDVLRLKGFLAVHGKPMRLVLQGVGDRIQHYFDRAWRSDEACAGRLVVIGERGLDREAIAAALCD